MKKYRHILSVVLLLSITTPFFAAYIFLHVQKKQIRREIKRAMIATIDPSELVLLKFSKEETTKELRWEHSKEFEYRAEMYDIVSEEDRVDSIFYWCWWDYEETKLNKQLDHLLIVFLGQDSKHQQREHLIVDFFKNIYHSKIMDWNSMLNCFQLSRSDYYLFPFQDIILSRNYPPPETRISS